MVTVTTSMEDEQMGQFLTARPAKSVEETVKYLLTQIDNATRENSGGEFVNFDGGRRRW